MFNRTRAGNTLCVEQTKQRQKQINKPCKTITMNAVITKIRTELLNTFNHVFDVFTIREDVLYYKPANEGWSIYQVLEHILLANHFLLRIVDKQKEKAMQLAKSSAQLQVVEAYALDIAKLKRMELTGSYVWVPQKYTEPHGDVPLLQIKMSLHDQLNESLALLQNKQVIEALITTYHAGKIDALHYLYFLIQHMQRHLQQVQRTKKEFREQGQTVENNSLVTKAICLN